MQRFSALIAAVIAFGALTATAAAAPAPASADAAQAATTVTIRSSAFGRILFDRRGYALYVFTKDPRGRSVCYGDCAVAWPPYIVRGALRAPTGVKPSLLGTTRRRDGSRQLTIAGHPVYLYVGDRRVGQVSCQNVLGFGGLWLVVRPNGTIVR
jgi:predicted lipoprotein with Yx(FWY)xxD motif